jgi:hexosaminidase
MAAIAERFWSPREVVDISSMYTRMERVSRELEWLGLRHREDRLERLSGNVPNRSVEVLAGVSEAAGIEVRRGARHYTSLVPLDRFVDAVTPESEKVRSLEEMAARLKAADVEGLRLTFAEWSRNDELFEATAAGNGFLEELRPLSKNLSAVGAIGLEGLRYFQSGERTPAGWIESQTQLLDDLQKPAAEVFLAAVKPVRALLKTLGERERTLSQ